MDGTEHPAEMFAGFGIPRQMVGTFLPELSGPVTDAVVADLPGAAAADLWLFSSVYTHLQLVPNLLTRLEPTLERWLSSATLISLWSYSVWYELRGRSGGTLASPPVPSAALRSYRQTATRRATGVLAPYFRGAQALPTLRGQQAEMVRGLAEKDGEPHGSEWGGWLVLAVVRAVQANDVLPRPGRKRFRFPWNRAKGTGAGMALDIGEAFAVQGALGLLDGR